MNRSLGENSTCSTSSNAPMLDSNQGDHIASFEVTDPPPNNRLPTNVSGTQSTEINSGHGATNANGLSQTAFTLNYDG